MKKTIRKFPLPIAHHRRLELPANPRLLCVQVQTGVPCLWAEVYPDSTSKTTLDVWMVGTGQAGVPPDGTYLGTVQLNNGTLVLHVYISGRPFNTVEGC